MSWAKGDSEGPSGFFCGYAAFNFPSIITSGYPKAPSTLFEGNFPPKPAAEVCWFVLAALILEKSAPKDAVAEVALEVDFPPKGALFPVAAGFTTSPEIDVS